MPLCGLGADHLPAETELSIGAWHWNPNAAWSDAANKRGYFTGSADVTEAIRYSYGYPLTRRGHTRNGGAERGYSRLTDGNPDALHDPKDPRSATGYDHPRSLRRNA